MQKVRIGALCVLFTILLCIFFIQQRRTREIPVYTHEKSVVAHESLAVDSAEQVQTVSSLQTPVRLLFVGDVMLGRAVESRMNMEGMSFPFEQVRQLLIDSDVTIGNFEGVVTKNHVQTPIMTYQFAIKPEFLSYLGLIGFDILSLANNHSLDFGTSSLAYTRTLCAQSDIACIGDPTDVHDHSVRVVQVGETRIGFIFLNFFNTTLSEKTITEYITRLEEESDMQIAYVHWGDEYMLLHSSTQERFAKMLIDGGVESVIGHHPHVAQDIGMYKGKPIFYSLGNFIFDQYFSQNVQESYGVLLEIQDSQLTYTTIPFSSIAVRNQPQVMEDEPKRILIDRIFSNIQFARGVNVEQGTIQVSREYIHENSLLKCNF